MTTVSPIGQAWVDLTAEELPDGQWQVTLGPFFDERAAFAYVRAIRVDGTSAYPLRDVTVKFCPRAKRDAAYQDRTAQLGVPGIYLPDD